MSLLFLTIFMLCVIVAIWYLLKILSFSSYKIKWDFSKEQYVIYVTSCYGLLSKPLRIKNNITYYSTREAAQQYIEKIKTQTL